MTDNPGSWWRLRAPQTAELDAPHDPETLIVSTQLLEVFADMPERLRHRGWILEGPFATRDEAERAAPPIPMILQCPACLGQHIDAPDASKGWTNPPHRSHECQACGTVWRPCDRPTTGVAAIETKGSADGQAGGALADAPIERLARLLHAKLPRRLPERRLALASRVWTAPPRKAEAAFESAAQFERRSWLEFAATIAAIAAPVLAERARAISLADYDARAHDAATHAFGEDVVADLVERAQRHVEESLETAQSFGCDALDMHELVDYVFARPPGERRQEIGGSIFTLAILAKQAGIGLADAAEAELARFWSRMDVIRVKQAAKKRDSALPGSAVAASVAEVDAQIDALMNAPETTRRARTMLGQLRAGDPVDVLHEARTVAHLAYRRSNAVFREEASNA